MILLAIDTATENCSAALWVDGKIFHRSTIQPRLHAELILPFIDELLLESKIKKQAIDGIVVGQGPGAFTGVRIGVGVAQGLALALDIPVVAVSNLETLAFAAYHQLNTDKDAIVLVATDARMKEVYWAKYAFIKGVINQLSPEAVAQPTSVDLSEIDIHIGSGFSVYPQLIAYDEKKPMTFKTNVFSHAKDMLLMTVDAFFELATPIDEIQPVYLREP
jgi:tRNA threonylcarbamoyladenosine biosynthesis protein TsaB